jgi:hypothetical protein
MISKSTNSIAQTTALIRWKISRKHHAGGVANLARKHSKPLINGAPFSYITTPDAQGYDAAVTGYRKDFAGAMNAASPGNEPSFTIQTQVQVQ